MPRDDPADGPAPVAPRGADVVVREVPTRHGEARVHAHRVADPRGTLILGHGAGGGVEAPDLLAATSAGTGARWDVVLVEQPYRVAGRRVPPRAPVLDAAWCDVVEHLRTGDAGTPLAAPVVVGGRSSGARVACRTASATGAAGVLCLAFPLVPPSRADAAPKPSRVGELDAVHVPVLVVQGRRDPFGVPPEAPGRTIEAVAGDHALKADLTTVRAAIGAWLRGLQPTSAPEDVPGR